MQRLMKAPKKYKAQLENKNALPKKWNLVRGDDVIVVDGPCEGQRGIIQAVIRKMGRVVIEGVNVRPRKMKANPGVGLKAAVIDKPSSIHFSNVNLVCPVTNLPTRISHKYLSDGTKVRISKRSGAVIPRPEILTQRRRPKSLEFGENDTTAEDSWEVTYKGDVDER